MSKSSDTKDLPYFKLMPEYVVVCAYFGCGKHLTLMEKLAGTRCEKHIGVTRISPDKILRNDNR